MSKVTINHIARYIMAPVLFLTVALTAGIRIQPGTNALLFVHPPLVSCIVGALAIVLLVRCGVVQIAGSDDRNRETLDIASRLVLMAAVYLATVQVFNSVTPEAGLLNAFFNLFYLLILLNYLFVLFNPRRLAGALATLLGASFMLKYLLLADLFAPASSWSKYVVQELMKVGTLGILDQGPIAPATGYLAFFSVALYLLGLYLIAPRMTGSEALLYKILANQYSLTPSDRIRLIKALARLEPNSGAVGADVEGLEQVTRFAEPAPKRLLPWDQATRH